MFLYFCWNKTWSLYHVFVVIYEQLAKTRNAKVPSVFFFHRLMGVASVSFDHNSADGHTDMLGCIPKLILVRNVHISLSLRSCQRY